MDKIEFKGYRICKRDPNTDKIEYSNGIVRKWGDNHYVIFRRTTNKVWKDLKALQAHLIKCVECGINMDDWVVLEVTSKEYILPASTEEHLTFARLKVER